MTFITEMTVYITITTVLILIFKKLFKNKLSAKWHLWIWAIILIRFLIPFLPQSEISVFNAFNIPTTSYEQTFIPIKTTNVGSTYTTEVEAKTNGDLPLYENTNENIVKSTLIRNIWFVGMISLFAYFIIFYIMHLHSLKKRKEKVDDYVFDLIRECKKTLCIKRSIKIISGNTAMLVGFIKPKIVIPEGYGESETKSIIMHELCHLKNNDIILIWISVIFLCMNWFNPVIWYSFFVFRRDIEVYCDERVLKYTNNKKDYANLLLKTALKKNIFVLGTTSLQNGKKEVERRIKYIANFKKPKFIWSMIILAIAIIIGAVCLTNANTDYFTDYSGNGYNFLSPCSNIKTIESTVDYNLITVDEKAIAVAENVILENPTYINDTIHNNSERISSDFIQKYGFDVYCIKEIISVPAVSGGGEIINATTYYIKNPDQTDNYVVLYFKTGLFSESEISKMLKSFKFVFFNKNNSAIIETLPTGANIIMNSDMNWQIAVQANQLSEIEKLVNYSSKGMVSAENFKKELGFNTSDHSNKLLDILITDIELEDGAVHPYLHIFNNTNNELLVYKDLETIENKEMAKSIFIELENFSNASIKTALYTITELYLENEFHRVYTPYYEILNLEIVNWQESEKEATFFYTMTHKNYDKDPDTVGYIKEAKENGSKYYEQLKKEYLEPMEANYEFKVIFENKELKLYSNDSPIGYDWQPCTIDDFIIK